MRSSTPLLVHLGFQFITAAESASVTRNMPEWSLSRNSESGGADRHAQTQRSASTHGRDRCLSVYSGEQCQLGGSDRLRAEIGKAGRRRIKDPGLSLREGSER